MGKRIWKAKVIKPGGWDKNSLITKLNETKLKETNDNNNKKIIEEMKIRKWKRNLNQEKQAMQIKTNCPSPTTQCSDSSRAAVSSQLPPYFIWWSQCHTLWDSPLPVRVSCPDCVPLGSCALPAPWLAGTIRQDMESPWFSVSTAQQELKQQSTLFSS